MDKLLQTVRDYFLCGIPVMEVLQQTNDENLRAVILKEYMKLDVELMLRCGC